MTPLAGVLLALFAVLTLRWLTLLLAALRYRPPQLQAPAGVCPSVCALVPAYNEAQHIEHTLRALRGLRYPALEVLVIDDGSSDDTAARAQPHARVLRLPHNVGKAQALNAGLAASRSELVLTVDADTMPAPDCLSQLVAALQQMPAAAGAAARIEPAGEGSLCLWQRIEYACNQNLDRRAQAWFGAVTTAPGATSLWRRDQLERAGGFPGRTLTEDADLTLTLLRRDERTLYVPHAVSRTRVPRRWGELWRQRRRWLHGNLHCAWLHRGGLWSGPWAMRLFAMPNFIFAHAVVYLLFPVACALLGRGMQQWGVGVCFISVAVLFALDVILSVAALRLQGPGPSPPFGYIALQRLIFPFFLWGVFASVAVGAVAGVPVRWRTLGPALASR